MWSRVCRSRAVEDLAVDQSVSWHFSRQRTGGYRTRLPNCSEIRWLYGRRCRTPDDARCGRSDITQAPTVSLSIKSVAARAGVKPRRYDEIPTTSSHAKRRRNPPFDATKGGRSSPFFGREGDELSPFP